MRFLVGEPDSEVTRAREADEAVPLTLSVRIRVTLAELENIKDVDGTPVPPRAWCAR